MHDEPTHSSHLSHASPLGWPQDLWRSRITRYLSLSLHAPFVFHEPSIARVPVANTLHGRRFKIGLRGPAGRVPGRPGFTTVGIWMSRDIPLNSLRKVAPGELSENFETAGRSPPVFSGPLQAEGAAPGPSREP